MGVSARCDRRINASAHAPNGRLINENVGRKKGGPKTAQSIDFFPQLGAAGGEAGRCRPLRGLMQNPKSEIQNPKYPKSKIFEI
jgi:hypothetical protein